MVVDCCKCGRKVKHWGSAIFWVCVILPFVLTSRKVFNRWKNCRGRHCDTGAKQPPATLMSHASGLASHPAPGLRDREGNRRWFKSLGSGTHVGELGAIPGSCLGLPKSQLLWPGDRKSIECVYVCVPLYKCIFQINKQIFFMRNT